MAPELARSLRDGSLHFEVDKCVEEVSLEKVGLSPEVFDSPQLSPHVVTWSGNVACCASNVTGVIAPNMRSD